MSKLRFKESIIKKIFKFHGLEDVKSISYIDTSYNPCIIINDKYVIRMNIRKSGILHFRKEYLVMNWLKKLTIPVPKILVVDDTRKLIKYPFIIMNKLEGTEVNSGWNQLTSKEKQKIAFDAGVYLTKIHSIQFKEFGDIRANTLGEYPCWYDYLIITLKKQLKNCAKYKSVDIKTRKITLDLFIQNKSLLNAVKNPVLVHGDYHFRNILHKKDKITGIIDFEVAIAGDSEFDLKNIEDQFRRLEGFEKPFMKGYLSKTKLSKDFKIKYSLYTLFFLTELSVTARRFWRKETRERIKNQISAEIAKLTG